MGAIHQLLPARKDALEVAKKVREETAKVLGKDELLEGHDKFLVMHDESRKSEEIGASGTEHRELTTTVFERLEYERPFKIRHADADLQLTEANQLARADIVLDDGTVLGNVPVTFLMEYKKVLEKDREVLAGAPTLDTKIRWEDDKSSALRGTRKTVENQTTSKTEKQPVVIEKAKPTDKHPAQVELRDKDVVVGHYELSRQTGKLTPAEKHARLARYDELIRAFKRALAVGNETDVPSVTLGKEIYDFLLG